MTDVQPPYRNSLEAAYAKHLAAEQAAGRIATWGYEVTRLTLDGETLALGQHYTPDFTIEYEDGTVEYHETKGFFYEQDRVRTKQAAARYLNHRFIIVTRKRGKWILTPILRAWEVKKGSRQDHWNLLLRARRTNEREYKLRDYALQNEMHRYLEAHPRWKPAPENKAD